jgi:peroxiredoxin
MFLRRKHARRHPLFSFLIQTVIFLALYFAFRAWTQREMVNGPAPDIAAIAISGESVSLRQYRGEPLLLHFWASWCKICQFERSTITNIDKNWPVLTVAMQSGNKEEVTTFMEKHHLKWTTLVDESGELTKRYGVPGVPASFIIDSSGNIRFKEMGYTTSWGLKFRLWLTTFISIDS